MPSLLLSIFSIENIPYGMVCNQEEKKAIPPALTPCSLLRLPVQNRLRRPTEFSLDPAPGKVHER
jgi:hypothetical protein